MPRNNRFHHQQYGVGKPTATFELIAAEPGQYLEPDDSEIRARMARVGGALRAHGVSNILLVHGTFVGEDAFGAVESLERLLPENPLVQQVRAQLEQIFPGARSLRKLNKGWKDAVRSDRGNFTEKYALSLQQALGGDIAIRRFNWSSANNHVARAEAAARLLGDLLRTEPDGRILLCGHSHAGNVFAIASNLLANHRPAVEAFLDAGQIYLRGCPEWSELARILSGQPSPCPLAQQLDIVTLGTPVRYGWDLDGLHQLLHVVHHRPAEGMPEYLAPAHQAIMDIIQARYGDYIQIAGVAGSDFAPISSDKYWADRRLGEVLQQGLDIPKPEGGWTEEMARSRHGAEIWALINMPKWLLAGQRVHADGHTVLVDYRTDDTGIFGHSVYTMQDWMLFHAEQITEKLYK